MREATHLNWVLRQYIHKSAGYVIKKQAVTLYLKLNEISASFSNRAGIFVVLLFPRYNYTFPCLLIHLSFT